ncbi:MAG: hypothetical protein HYS83_02200 [Candidatus Blackburnbacteria bacterium]|nr:hypothetical protein [Candidatus Blackburnbacteria bacterium]
MNPTQDKKPTNEKSQANIPVIDIDQEASPPPQAPPEIPEPKPMPDLQIPVDEAGTAGLPPIISPPQKKKGLPISMFGMVTLLLLVVSIPVGVFLVKQQQELRSQAYEAADCDEGDRGGLKEETQDCDVNTNQLVQVFVCNNTERLPGTPTGQACPQAPAPPAVEAPSSIESDADGPGGCCSQDAATNSAQGCRQGNGFNEICDVSNGACASGFSCRSIAGCTQDSDCGPGNECKNSQCQAIPPPSGQYTSCASWGFSDDPSNTADPTCETDPTKNGFSCRRSDGVAVCAYRNGAWYEGQQGNCENLGNGTVKTNTSATIDEYHCPEQTSSVGSCSQGKTTRGLQGPGTYTVGGNNCGGHQIDAQGLCGSYVFRGTCVSQQPVLQCTAVKFYDANWNLIANPQAQLRAGQRVNIAVAGSNIGSATFKINGRETAATQRNMSSGELYANVEVPSGQFTVEAQVYR